jgi:hypothetical protein
MERGSMAETPFILILVSDFGYSDSELWSLRSNTRSHDRVGEEFRHMFRADVCQIDDLMAAT